MQQGTQMTQNSGEGANTSAVQNSAPQQIVTEINWDYNRSVFMLFDFHWSFFIAAIVDIGLGFALLITNSVTGFTLLLSGITLMIGISRDWCCITPTRRNAWCCHTNCKCEMPYPNPDSAKIKDKCQQITLSIALCARVLSYISFFFSLARFLGDFGFSVASTPIVILFMTYLLCDAVMLHLLLSDVTPFRNSFYCNGQERDVNEPKYWLLRQLSLAVCIYCLGIAVVGFQDIATSKQSLVCSVILILLFIFSLMAVISPEDPTCSSRCNLPILNFLKLIPIVLTIIYICVLIFLPVIEGINLFVAVFSIHNILVLVALLALWRFFFHYVALLVLFGIFYFKQSDYHAGNYCFCNYGNAQDQDQNQQQNQNSIPVNATTAQI